MNPQLAANAVNANNIASGQVVKSFNGLTDAVSLSAGTSMTFTTNGNVLQISASNAVGGKDPAAITANAETNLTIIRGTINSSGAVLDGSGFTVEITSPTTRIINFTTAFSGFPTIALGQHGSSGSSIVDLVSSTASSFSTVANGSAGFEFIAIGPK